MHHYAIEWAILPYCRYIYHIHHIYHHYHLSLSFGPILGGEVQNDAGVSNLALEVNGTADLSTLTGQKNQLKHRFHFNLGK